MNNKLLENIIRESVENYIDEYTVDRLAKKVILDKIEEKLGLFTNDYIQKKIDESIDGVLKGEINTDDGWGKKEHYDSFEDMFKQRFNKHLNDTWEIKRVIKDTVEERLNDLFKKKAKEVTSKIQDMVLEEMLKEGK